MLAKTPLRKHLFPESANTASIVSTRTSPSLDNQTIQQYKRWLAEEARRNTLSNQQAAIDKYKDEAKRIVIVGKRQICAYAPFSSQYSALKTLTRRQAVLLIAAGVVAVLGLFFFQVGAVVAVIAIVSILYLLDLFLSSYLSVRTLNVSSEIDIDDRLVFALADTNWPKYTILCPLYHEVEVVPQFVQAMQALDYPKDKLQILFLTEEDDVATRNAIAEMRLPPHFVIVTVPDGKPRTKPRACNYGLLKATGDYVVIYDAEDVPEPLQLKKAVLAFAQQGEKTACIQAKLNFYNAEQNILTRWFTAEYSLWFDLTLPGLQKMGVPLPLGGTSNHFRTSLLRLLGAWDAYNVTEDCDLGLRQAAYGYKTAVLNSTTYEEANSQFKNWIRQRSRWIKGYMQTYLVYMRNPRVYLRRDRLLEFLSLQVFVGGKTAVLFVNPFMWLLLGIYIVFHPFVVDFYHILFPGPVLYMGALCLIFGNFFYVYTHIIGCLKRGYFHLAKWTLFIPIYWAISSIAAFMALQQLIFKPHYWEKTMHGLHLRSAGPLPKITVVSEMHELIEITAQPTFELPSVSVRAMNGERRVMESSAIATPDFKRTLSEDPTVKIVQFSRQMLLSTPPTQDAPIKGAPTEEVEDDAEELTVKLPGISHYTLPKRPVKRRSEESTVDDIANEITTLVLRDSTSHTTEEHKR